MKIVYKKITGSNIHTSTYEIHLVSHSIARPLGHVQRGTWHGGATRWEFRNIGGGLHPLTHHYPDSLADAKELVSHWVISACRGILETPPFSSRHYFKG